MIKRMLYTILWLTLAMMLVSCNGEGASIDPSFNDGLTPSIEIEIPEPNTNNTAVPIPSPDINDTAVPMPTPELEEPEYNTNPAYTYDELIQVSKFLYQEARGVKSDTQVACVAWVVCNRVDGGYGDTISEIWGYPQIWYDEKWPVTDRMFEIAKDVLDRWSVERQYGYCDGRVLPADYFWYTGDGVANYFRNVYRDYDNVWDYSMPSPYDS